MSKTLGLVLNVFVKAFKSKGTLDWGILDSNDIPAASNLKPFLLAAFTICV